MPPAIRGSSRRDWDMLETEADVLYAVRLALTTWRDKITDAEAVAIIRAALAKLDAVPVEVVQEIEGLPPLYS